MWRRIWVTLAVVAGVVIAAPFVLTLPLPTGDLEDVAARFQPEGYAAATEPSIEPYRIWCLGDRPCPDYSRSWSFDHVISGEQFQSWLDAAGFPAAVEGDCRTACWARGSVDRREFYISLDVPWATKTSLLWMSVH